MNVQSELSKNLLSSAENLRKLATDESCLSSVEKAVATIVSAYRENGCMYVAGNGGSAADAQHLVAELVSKLKKDRSPIRGYAMTVDTSILTAIGNDYGYDQVFARQVDALMDKRDIFFAITTSGQSPNILRALEMCKSKGIRTILLTGRDGGPAAKMADHAIIVPGAHTAEIQEAHLAIYHNLCWLLENALVESGHVTYK